MAIQVPRLSVNPQAEQENAPRIQAPALNAEAPMEKQQSTLEGVAKDAIKLQTEVQHQQADTTATNKSNDFMLWRKKRLYGDPESGWTGYANITGKDPQELYKQFDKEVEEKLNNLSSPGDGETWSNETQTLVNRRLSRHYQESELETLTQYSNQKKKWDDSLSDTNVGLAQQGMFGASSFITPGDSSSFGALEAKIAGIRNTRISQARRTFGAVEDENGDVAYNDGTGTKSFKLTPQVKYEIAKDVAKGLTDATKNLVDSNSLDKARALKQWADDNGYLDKASLGHLQEKLDKAELKHEAYANANEARQTGNENLLDRIEDPEVRAASKKAYAEEAHYDEFLTKRKSKQNYNELANYVGDVMRSDHPFRGPMDAENDKKFASIIDNVTDGNQRKALYAMISEPKDSAPKAQEKMVDLFFGHDTNHPNVKEMSQSEFEIYKSGLDKIDRRKYQNMFEKAHLQTDAQVESQYKQFGKEFEQQAIGAQLLRKMPNSNFYTPSDQIRANVLKKELLDSLDGLGPMSPKDRSDYVAKFVSDKLANVAFKPPDSPRFNGGVKPTSPTTPVTDDTQAAKGNVDKYWGSINPAQRMRFALDYMKEKQTKQVPNENELKAWVATKVKF